jgi:TolA-binding protein
MMSRFVSMLMLAGLVAASGCEQKPADRTPSKVTSGDVRRDSGHTAETVGDYSRQTKEEFQKKLDIRLKEMNAEIAKLREKGRGMKDKAKWNQTMTELEAKRDAARAKLTEISHSSQKAWKDVEKGAQSAWDELDNAFRDASREF